MKLTFIFANRVGEHIAYQATGCSGMPEKRSVTIELTQDQLDTLHIVPKGIDCGREYFEDIVDIFVETPE